MKGWDNLPSPHPFIPSSLHPVLAVNLVIYNVMSKFNNIYLIGPMGSGKTSVGMQLAKKAKMKFFDSDTEIERRSGVTISWIFEVEKEAGFRQREAKMIEELTSLDQIILATGGGCILTPRNRELLSNTGVVVYLKVSLPEQLRRTSHRQGVRPLVNVPDPAARLTQLNREREPLYLSIADLIYNTDLQLPQVIAQHILHDIKNLKAEQASKTS